MRYKELRECACNMLTGKWLTVMELVDEIKKQHNDDVGIGRTYALMSQLQDEGVVRSRYRELAGQELKDRGGRRQHEFTLISRGTRERSVDAVPGGLVFA